MYYLLLLSVWREGAQLFICHLSSEHLTKRFESCQETQDMVGNSCLWNTLVSGCSVPNTNHQHPNTAMLSLLALKLRWESQFDVVQWLEYWAWIFFLLLTLPWSLQVTLGHSFIQPDFHHKAFVRVKWGWKNQICCFKSLHCNSACIGFLKWSFEQGLRKVSILSSL